MNFSTKPFLIYTLLTSAHPINKSVFHLKDICALLAWKNISAFSQFLPSAYHKTTGHHTHARVFNWHASYYAERRYWVDGYSGLILISTAKQQAHIPLTRHTEMQINMHIAWHRLLLRLFTDYSKNVHTWVFKCLTENLFSDLIENLIIKGLLWIILLEITWVLSCTVSISLTCSLTSLLMT